ncbi:M20/M25/M40 family metallo-hydrolase [Mangrovimonas aestuarii]|uniref:M20/M25/M40 family metallo-hydrolase n=1 Tax=Mangrovimonas aestuarii TaxID=3018443 RepID=UPI00237911C2|nr:M20/M25/M40 family metallo-hydrolase [Mangrovimonas aestuarii]
MKQLIFLSLLTLFTACKKNPSLTENNIKKDITFLADDKLEGRETGTKGEEMAANYIAKRFKQLQLSPKGTNGFLQTFSFKPKINPHENVKYTNTSTESSITGSNVIGFLDNKASNTIVIGAHYDHLGFGDENSLHRGERAIHNGADDNASGVAVMLRLAGLLNEQNKNNNYLFIAFSGEEMGLLGSNYFVKHPTVDLKTINYMINLDMVGRLKPDNTLAVYGIGTSPSWKQTINATNTNFKLTEKESGIGPSDHTSFYLHNIPVLHFFTGQHKDYHKPDDDIEKLNYEGMEAISNYIFDITTELDDNAKLAFRKTKNESEEVPRFKVTLGVVPDYLFDGKGMRIDGISEGKPAQIAGLQKGDIVLKLGDLEVIDMMSYMKALAVYNKGDETEVTVNRNGDTLIVNLKF